MLAKGRTPQTIHANSTGSSIHFKAHTVKCRPTQIFRPTQIILKFKIMITCLVTFFIFAAGYLVAAIDWREFVKDAFTVQGM